MFNFDERSFRLRGFTISARNEPSAVVQVGSTQNTAVKPATARSTDIKKSWT